MSASANTLPPSPGDSPGIWTFGRAELDDHRHELRIDGHAVALEAKPYALLRLLLQRAGETLSKDELIDAVWPGRVVTEGVLAKCVTKLRSALADDDQAIIKTVHGYGYRLSAAVSARTVDASAAKWAPQAGEAMPTRPNWHFVRELRGGGFGQVWLAEQTKTREQRVFKFAVDGAELHALKREITLYRLLHDSLGERAEIVRIIDWNVDEPPYFIESEYVSGGNLIEWCEARGGFAEIANDVRIEIIARIADALSATHSVGVLHKDLKPANVLIVADGELAPPRIRLVDFGSGRALEPERLAALGITRLGMTQTRVDGDSTSGTPYYLAPELIAGKAPTVQADVYALGVMLYQFLVGDFRAPLAPGWERDIDDELLREDIAATADLDPDRRLGDIGELARRLRALPARAAERARERVALAQVQRQQQQLLRWQASRRWLLALCAVFAIAAAAVGSLYLREQRAAAMQRDVNSFLNDDLLAAANPYATQRSDLRVRDVLDRARGAVGERFAGKPAEEAAIRTTLGNSYRGLGDYTEAGKQFTRALSLLAASDGERSVQAIALRRAIADDEVLETRYDDADKVYASLLADLAAADGDASDAALELRVAQAHLELRRGHDEAAAKALESLLPRLRESKGNDDDATLSALSDLGQAYRGMAHFDQAEAVYREVYDARQKRFGDAHSRTLEALQDLAQLERSRSHLDNAVDLERKVVAGREKTFGREHEETQNALNELASMYQDQGKFDSAEPLFREVLAVRERTLGERHEHTRNSMNNLGLVLSLQGKLDEAEGYFRRVLAIETEMLGADNLQVLILMHNLADLERDRKRYDDAEALHREVIERVSRTLAPERPERGLFLAGFARTLQAQKRYAESADAFAQARTNLVAAYGPTHARVVKLDQMRVALYQEWGRPMPVE
ncbi:MAG TPA: tetratricopeptide repeat protein [Rudaea sp.]|jgi:non-specific serine/threonine protein kinase